MEENSPLLSDPTPWQRFRRNRVAMGSLYTIIAICVLAFITPALPLQAPRMIQTENQFQGPKFYPLFVETIKLPGDEGVDPNSDPLEVGFGKLGAVSRAMLDFRVAVFGRWSINSICGTDALGRDLLSRIFWGARVSLIVALVATAVSLIIGVSYGTFSGYVGGQVDNLMMRFVDVLYSIPFIFIVIFIVTILGAEQNRDWLESHGINRITIFYLVTGAIYWLTMARVVRGQTLSLKNEPFVEAARSLGAGTWRILTVHLIPNLTSVIIVYLTLTIPRVILFEAFLSFLGLGVEQPDVSWGLLARDGVNAVNSVKIYWWLVVYPSMALGLTLFALNFLGDGLRDAFDPKLKNN